MNRIIFIVKLVCCSLFATSIYAQNIVDAHGQLHIDGTKIKDDCDRIVELRGMSYFWHQWEGSSKYMNSEVIEWLRDDWEVQVVRCAMGIEFELNGYLKDSNLAIQSMKKTIEAAIKSGVYVVVDWHAHELHLEEAKAFFALIAKDYGNYPNIIYEIFNEPTTETWQEIKDYAEEVIASIREYDPDNIIVVGTPTWDIKVNEAAKNPIIHDSKGKSASNIAYALHFYAGSHMQDVMDIADSALNNGICLFVTECGSTKYNAMEDNYESWNNWVNWMDENDISWCKWSLSTKKEDSSTLKKRASKKGKWNYNKDLTCSGKYIRDQLKALNSIPEKCTQ